MARPDAIIATGLKWLAGQQAANGSFKGQAGPISETFKPTLQHDTVFFTALILICLEKAADADQIIKPAVKFLKKQAGPLGSWNYWRRESAWSANYPYPDDLDDTALALLALGIHEPSFVSGERLAQLAKLLISNEIRPGGPYRTWLVQPQLYKTWGDVDVAVNANIGGLLEQHAVKMPVLENFMTEKLAAGELGSRYYVGHTPSLYFLSRWYRGAQTAYFKQLIRDELRESHNTNGLSLALLLTAGCRLGLATPGLRLSQQRLVKYCKNGCWPAEALYADPVIDNIQHYAGSATLTTAFALEALLEFANYSHPAPRQTAKTPRVGTAKQALAQARSLPDGLRKDYRQAVIAISRHDDQQQINAMANLTAEAYDQIPSSAILGQLNLGSLNGWIAYSVYDDFFDEESRPATLAVANYAHRQAILSYDAALGDDHAFQKLVNQTFNIMDNANRWEVLNARGHLTGKQLKYKLPAYDQYGKLAERSWGHMLAAVGTLVILGYDMDSQPVRQLQIFFHHFLIARQLNDDAHDWQADLQRGHLSAAVCLLLGDYKPAGPIELDTEITALQQHFWQVSIIKIDRLISKHLSLARRALTKSGMIKPVVFAGWLDALATASNQAATGSKSGRDFIRAYRHN
jgi:hypothetical protein